MPLGNVSITTTDAMTLPSINAATILARTTGVTSDHYPRQQNSYDLRYRQRDHAGVR